MGDVVVAELAYEYDEGKLTTTGFDPDRRQIQLDRRWARAALGLRPDTLPSYSTATPEETAIWFLEQLMSGADPRQHPACFRYFPGPAWSSGPAALARNGLVARASGGRWQLTDAGHDHIEAHRRAHRHRLRPQPPQGPADLAAGPAPDRRGDHRRRPDRSCGSAPKDGPARGVHPLRVLRYGQDRHGRDPRRHNRVHPTGGSTTPHPPSATDRLSGAAGCRYGTAVTDLPTPGAVCYPPDAGATWKHADDGGQDAVVDAFLDAWRRLDRPGDRTRVRSALTGDQAEALLTYCRRRWMDGREGAFDALSVLDLNPRSDPCRGRVHRRCHRVHLGRAAEGSRCGGGTRLTRRAQDDGGSAERSDQPTAEHRRPGRPPRSPKQSPGGPPRKPQSSPMPRPRHGSSTSLRVRSWTTTASTAPARICTARVPSRARATKGSHPCRFPDRTSTSTRSS